MRQSITYKTLTFFRDIARGEIVAQAILVGILTGFCVVLFNFSIIKTSDSIQKFLVAFPLWQKLIILPTITALGGLISGYLVFKFAPETKGSGIPYVKLALARMGKGIRARSFFVKFFAGIIGIGSGLSLGKEGPSVQMGAGAGAIVSKLFKKRGTNQHNLIVSGAAAAIGATFNAPISGMVFALEELIQKFSPSILFPVMVATVTAVTISRYFSGSNPTFDTPKTLVISLVSPSVILVYILLGVFAAILGVLFAKNIFTDLRFFARLKNIPNFIKPAIAGALVGVVGVFLPEILGTGSIAVNALLAGKYLFSAAVLIFVVKFFATTICFGSGAAGGIFLPMLMLGSFLGYALGLFANFCGCMVNPVSLSVVGMGAFLAAVARSPITAVMMVVEMTGDYNSILPVMLAVATADLLAEKFGQAPIYTTLILRQTKLPENVKRLDEKVSMRVDSDIPKLNLSSTVEEALNVMRDYQYDVLPVVSDNGKLEGSISKSDISDSLISKDARVEAVMNPDVLSIKSDDSLFKAAFLMHVNQADFLCVISRTGKFKGFLKHSDIVVNNICL